MLVVWGGERYFLGSFPEPPRLFIADYIELGFMV